MLNYKSIAEGARAFYNLGMLRIYKPEQYPVGHSVVPLYVNTAFACELYMKALILFEKPEMTKKEFKKLGHRLDNLFEALSPPIKAEIEKSFTDQSIQKHHKEAISSYQTFLSSDASDDEKDMAKQCVQQNAISFDEILKNHALAFEHWRYFYEAVDGCYIFCDEWFIYNFVTVLHNTVVRIMNQP